MFYTILFFVTTVQAVSENFQCSISSNEDLLIGEIPTTFELNVPYTVVLSSNQSHFLTHMTLHLDPSVTEISNDSICRSVNETSLSYQYKTEIVLKFKRNITKTSCLRLKLRNLPSQIDWDVVNLCSNGSTDKVIDNDDKYDVQSYMRTINTIDTAVLDNFNWLIFGSPTQQIWSTHEGMRLSRECDVAEDGRVAIFSNPRGKRRLISRPIDIFNVSLLYMRLGSGTCPPPAPMDPPLQIFFTNDCINYTNWRLIHSQKILPSIEDVTVSISSKNLSQFSSNKICLKIEQSGDRFAGGGSWFIDDFFIVRSRDPNDVFYDSFKTMRPAKWHRLAGGHWKTCKGRLSMVFEGNPDIRTEIGATTIDFALPERIDDDENILFHISKQRPIDWTKWNATGFVSLNTTCNEEDLITFNGDNYRQICSPAIELGRLDSIRFTLSTELCAKKQKQISNPDAMIFLSILYESSTVAYSRNIRRISLKEIKTTKTFNIRMNEVRHRAQTFGQICLSQYHQSTGNNVDMWSIRDFYALPQFPSNVTHFIQLQMNTKCSALPTTNGPIHPNVQIEYSLDFGKNWHGLLQTCYLDSSCSRDVQHVYSSQIVLSSSDWQRVTLPLPFAVLQQDYIRFRISSPVGSMSIYSNNDAWAIETIFIGRCHRACSGHGSCEWNSCRCDPGYSGEFCEMSNVTLIQRAAYLFEQPIENRTDLISYQGGRFNYKCNIISQGKALVFSKTDHRFVRLSNINGSSPKLVEFTLRLGSANQQCFGTSPNDIAQDLKSIILLTSCSNGVRWTIVDRFRISDLLAPDYGTLSRVIFQETQENDECLIEWRQMTHGGDNQDVWAIDDITVREIQPIKKPTRSKTFQSKLIYIRPGFVLSFQVDVVNAKDAKSLLDFHDFRLRINSTQFDLNRQSDLFAYQSEHSTKTIIVSLPKSIWFTYVIVNLTVVATKKYDLTNIHLGVRCENDCWLNGPCLEGICLPSTNRSTDSWEKTTLNENDIRQMRINLIDDELLLPLIDSTKLTDVHFQTLASTVTKNHLVFECSPNGGTTWFELAQCSGEKEKILKDHYVSLPSVCRSPRTLFRWKNTSIRLINIAFVQFQSRNYFMDQFETSDMTNWLYANFHVNASGLYPNKILNYYQLITTSILLKPHDHVLMIDIDPKLDNSQIDIDYSSDNTTWSPLITEREPKSPKHRFGRSIPKDLLGSSILIRLLSSKPFILQHIYLGPSCQANCYGQGKCLWTKQAAACQCDQNRTESDAHCLSKEILLPSLYETFEQPFNKTIWSVSSHAQFTRQCYNRLSKTTPYLCFLPHNHSQPAYAIVGPFEPIKYVSFKFGFQFINQGNCSTHILFQYSYDRGIQWFTKDILDETKSIFTTFDDLKINMNLYLRWIEGSDQSCVMWNLRAVTIRTKSDHQIWFDSNLDVQSKTKITYELQTWEYTSLRTNALIQFELQMFPVKSSNQTNWQLILEISTDIQDGWSSWSPLIHSCDQNNLYCDDNIALTGSSFLVRLYERPRNVTLPIPDIYASKDVRFRWIASEPDARFLVRSLYVGADCPWFCSGHGICQKNGCVCDVGYVLPFCSPDPLTKTPSTMSPNELDANLTRWIDSWGHERCSKTDGRIVFILAGTRGLTSPELSLMGMKYLRIELDSCTNRTDSFDDPILIQYSLNNGLFWTTLSQMTYRPEKPWLISLPKDQALQMHLARLRLFQRVNTKGASSWILKRFELIPEKLPQYLLNTNNSIVTHCYASDVQDPIEIYSTVDITLNETSFLTFQSDRNPCSKNTSYTRTNYSPWTLEYSTDYGQTWTSIDRPSTSVTHLTEIIIRQPLQSIHNNTTTFGLPLYAYLSLTKSLRIRWLAENVTIANLWRLRDVAIRDECDVICQLEPCQSKCSCSKTNSSCTIIASKKRTFLQKFDQKSSSIPEIIVVPPLNLMTTKFLEFPVQSHCKENDLLHLSIEYSRNLGLTWQLFHYYTFLLNQSNLIHEEFLDVMRDDPVQIRFAFQQSPPSCWKIEQILISGSTIVRDMIHLRFYQFNPLESSLFLSLGDSNYNATHLIYSAVNHSNLTAHELITDEFFISTDVLYIQLALFPLSTNICLNIEISFSPNYGRTWTQIDQNSKVYLFDKHQYEKQHIVTWRLTSSMLGANQGRFRFRFDINMPITNGSMSLFALSEFYLGGSCINGCNSHGMCTNTRQCRCDLGWTNNDCSLRLISFPHEIDVLDQQYFTSSGATNDDRCGLVFDHTCQRVMETKYIDIHHENAYVHVELNDNCFTNQSIRRNGDGWIRLQYREMNTYPWITLYIFKGYTLKTTQRLPPIILQLRLIQDAPMNDRSPWSIEQFNVFRFHSNLEWSLSDVTTDQKMKTSIFLSSKKNYQTKDVSFQSNLILQFETNCSAWTDDILRYSSDLGWTWHSISNDQQLSFVPIRFNQQFYRYTLPLQSILVRNNSIRFQIDLESSCQLQYLYVGISCPTNCFGRARCSKKQCLNSSVDIAPLREFRETETTHWLQYDVNRQAITQPIDLRPLKALKWTYLFDKLSKSCTTSIYLMISTDGTLTWSILHRFDVSIKTNSSVDFSIELQVNHSKNYLGQFRWYQPISSTCQNLTWNLSRIIPVKSINIYFLSDYFYTISSSRSNWESVEGALLAQIDQCNNNLPSLIFNQRKFSVVTVPILVQSHYVLVFQFSTKCKQTTTINSLLCENLTSIIEYRTESSSLWIQLADMNDISCRTSLINGGYFNVHMMKLPVETHSSGTQFRWSGNQAEKVSWSLHGLFIGECPNYCHDRGLCTISGCQCTINYSGPSCETYIGKEPLPLSFYETFDELSAMSTNGPQSNNWMKLTGNGHIRHVCDEVADDNSTTKYLSGQALHFGAGCGCAQVEAITRELNVTLATTISFAFHVTTEDNCIKTAHNITVALEWTRDEGMSWCRLITMYNREHPQFFNITLPTEMIHNVHDGQHIGGVRFRWTQVKTASKDVFWSIDNIRLE